MSGQSLLALDLAGNVGWALFREPTVPPRPPLFGEHRWQGQGPVAICGKFGDWLVEFHAVHRFAAMAWEEPWLRAGDKPETIKILFGLIGVAQWFTHSRKLPHTTVTPKDAKKWATGNSYAKKEQVLAAVMSVGWQCGSYDAADACAIGAVARLRLWPPRRAAA